MSVLTESINDIIAINLTQGFLFQKFWALFSRNLSHAIMHFEAFCLVMIYLQDY